MRAIGLILWTVGGVLCVYAIFLFDPSVSGGMFAGRVVNLALQQQQMMMVVCGAALFVAGVVLHGFAMIRPRAATGLASESRSWWRAYRDEVARIGADANNPKAP